MIPATPQRPLRAVAAFEWIPVVAGGFAVLIGALVLIGWWRDIDALTTIVPGLIPTIPNTAVAAIIGGLAVMSAVREQRDERFALITRGLAIALTTLGILFFFERLANVDLGIDLLLFGDAVRAMEWQPPGRPAINSALIMILDGAALLAIDVHTSRGRRPAELLSSLGAAIAFIGIVGYMYGVRGLYSFGPRTGMALLTAITFCVLSVGVLFARPDEGVASLIAAADPGAAMVRRLIPAAFIVPIGLGAVWLLARDANWVSRETAVSTFVLVHDEFGNGISDPQEMHTIRDIMANAVPGLRVPFKVDAEIGRSWGEAVLPDQDSDLSELFAHQQSSDDEKLQWARRKKAS